MSDNRSNRHPEFLQETMFQEHGTRVLITNPSADQYLDQYTAQKKKEEEIRQKYEQWVEPDGDPSF